jgi:hypothetical protein
MSRRFGKNFGSLPNALNGPGSIFMKNFEIIKKSFGYNDDYSVKEVEGLGDMVFPASPFWDPKYKAVRLT